MCVTINRRKTTSIESHIKFVKEMLGITPLVDYYKDSDEVSLRKVYKLINENGEPNLYGFNSFPGWKPGTLYIQEKGIGLNVRSPRASRSVKSIYPMFTYSTTEHNLTDLKEEEKDKLKKLLKKLEAIKVAIDEQLACYKHETLEKILAGHKKLIKKSQLHKYKIESSYGYYAYPTVKNLVHNEAIAITPTTEDGKITGVSFDAMKNPFSSTIALKKVIELLVPEDAKVIRNYNKNDLDGHQMVMDKIIYPFPEDIQKIRAAKELNPLYSKVLTTR